MYFTYDGTRDVAGRALFNSPDEAFRDDLSDQGEARECDDHSLAHDVRLSTDYGPGFSWPGRACPVCGVIVDGLRPPEDDEA